jgi:mono/diheme cytochrome c family protein
MNGSHFTVALGLTIAASVALANDGKALFAQHCATCHQSDAAGTVGLAPALKGEHWLKLGAERSYLPTVMLHGLSGPIKVAGQPFVGSMPAFAGQLDDAMLAAIATHLRSLQGAAGDTPYSVDEFKAVRSLAGSPTVTRQLRVKLVGN